MSRFLNGLAHLAVAVAILGPLAGADARAQAVQPTAEPAGGIVNQPVSIRSEMANRPPDVTLGSTRIWHLSATSAQRTAIIEMRGGLPGHLHPDGAHYLYVVEGEMMADINGRSYAVRPGDYFVVTANVPHAYHVAAGKSVVLLSVDAPAYDPKKTVWLDGPPKH